MRGMRIAVNDVYRFAWRHMRAPPAPLGYGLFRVGADAAWGLHRLGGGLVGVGQLEKNLARVLPASTTPGRVRMASRKAMRSYMRYFYEAFALSGMSEEQILARVRTDMSPQVRADLERGSIVLAMSHMGNWDLAGAWACRRLAPVLTVAERLEPVDLFEQFVSFREGLGMTIIGQGRGERVFDRLVDAAQEGGPYVIPLLADRDLSASGVEVDLCGHVARFAAGPAALAQRLGLPLYAGTIHYEILSGDRRRAAGSRWGLVLTLREVPCPQGPQGSSIRERVVAHTRAWAAVMGPLLAKHAIDWHMLQPVFDADLDHERLARSHALQEAGA